MRDHAQAALALRRESDPSLKFQRLSLTLIDATSSTENGISRCPLTSIMQPSLTTTWSKYRPSLSSTETIWYPIPVSAACFNKARHSLGMGCRQLIVDLSKSNYWGKISYVPV